jgi:hypothetical protein
LTTTPLAENKIDPVMAKAKPVRNKRRTEITE